MDSKEAIELIKSDVAHLVKIIQQQDKMIELAIDKLENGCCDAPESFDCDEVGMVCRDCWRKYLQGEVSK